MHTQVFLKDQPISRNQFRLYRLVFGAYLAIHFALLIPDGTELFSSDGVISSLENLPAFGKLPLLLFWNDSPQVVITFLMSLVVASGCLAAGYWQRVSAAWLLYGWVNLFNRNPFISNPSLAYLGWILLTFICIPSPEQQKNNWRFPSILYYGFWAITGVSYTVSGIHKLQCPSWLDGTAVYHVLTSVLARENAAYLVETIPPIGFKLITWVALFSEVSFLFLGVFKHLRKIYWYGFLFFHLGILATVNFTDLTFGMLIAHLYL